MARLSGAVGTTRWRGMPDYLTDDEASATHSMPNASEWIGVSTMGQGG
jgi:hypothetical protein